MPTDAELPPDRDLDIGLAVAAEVADVVAAADTKTGLVLAAQGVVLAVTVSASRFGTPAPAPHPRTVVALMLAATVVVLLGLALWPRTGGPAPRWIAFTAFEVGEPIPCRPGEHLLADQAWAQVAALSAIARRKLRWFRIALLVGSVELVVVVLSVTLGAGPTSTT